MKNPNEDFKRITVDQNLFDTIRRKNAFICDMDGVLYHGNRLIPGAKDFIEWLKREKKKFLFLTNSSERSPQELADKLQRLGIDVDKEHFYTSALATAEFLASQKPGGSAYIIGEAGLINALYNVGYTINDVNPDYVVVGEARTYNLEVLTHSVNLVRRGARLVGTNPDITGPVEKGIMPATGALVKPIELATGKKCYFVGKPNPLMMRTALKKLGCVREETAIIGDRMDTDILAGVETEMDTVLVLSGVTSPEEINTYAYRPKIVINDVGDFVR